MHSQCSSVIYTIHIQSLQCALSIRSGAIYIIQPVLSSVRYLYEPVYVVQCALSILSSLHRNEPVHQIVGVAPSGPPQAERLVTDAAAPSEPGTARFLERAPATNKVNIEHTVHHSAQSAKMRDGESVPSFGTSVLPSNDAVRNIVHIIYLTSDPQTTH